MTKSMLLLSSALLLALTNSYEYDGCYKDTGSRALRHGPHAYGYTPDTCSVACKDYKYFALQNGGWCCCENDYDHATKYGLMTGCPSNKMGKAWGNDLFLNVVPRSYTSYDNKQCVGTGDDILRDFKGTVAECQAKCDELDCIGFIRVHSGAPEHEGRCYFRGGEMERPYDYTQDDRDCYIPGQYGTARIVAHCDNHLYVYKKEWTDDWVKVGEESNWPTPWDYSFNVLASTSFKFDCKDKGGIGAFIATMNYNGMQYSTTNPISNSFFYITDTDVDKNNLKYRSKESSPWHRKTPGLADNSYWVEMAHYQFIEFQFDMVDVLNGDVPLACYTLEGNPSIIWGDPHTTTFAGVKHDFQGVPQNGLDQFYYLHPCKGYNHNDLPYHILGRHFPYRGSTRVSGLDYFAIELYDHNDHRFVAFFNSAIHGYIEGTVTDYDSIQARGQFGFRTCPSSVDSSTKSPESFTIDYQVGNSRYSCEINEANAYGALRTCVAATPTGQCHGSDEFIQINLEGNDDVCISHIIVDGMEIDITDQRLGDHVTDGPNSEGKSKVYKRRYDISNGIATMSLPNGYETSARVQPECASGLIVGHTALDDLTDGIIPFESGVDTKVGSRFVFNYVQNSANQITVTMRIDDSCTLHFTMIGQYDYSSSLGRYTMHYVRVNPPECYKCAICGLFGDFQGKEMQTCDGSTVSYGGYTNAWDERGWTWEKTYTNDVCEVQDTTTTLGPNDTPSPTHKPYVPPPDPTFPYDPCDDEDSHMYKESKRLCEETRAEKAIDDCCENIGKIFCDDLIDNCAWDACFASDGDDSEIQGKVDEILRDPIENECDDLVVDSEDYKEFQTKTPTLRPTHRPSQAPIATPEPTTAQPTTSDPTTANPTTAEPTKKPTHRPTTAEPTNKPTHRPTTAEPTDRPTHRPTTSEPTLKPTHRPTTAEPTMKPTHRPTTSDPTTAEPTKKPTHRPTTADPTHRPTTAEPTTAQPTTSDPTTAEPTKRPTDRITVDPTAAQTDEPSRRPTSATYLTPEPTKKPTEDQSGWGEPKPTTKAPKPTKGPKTPRPTASKPVKTPRPTKEKPTKAPKTPKPTKGPKTPRPTAAKPVKTPRPTAARPVKTPRPTKEKVVKTPRPTKGLKTGKPTKKPTRDQTTYLTPEPSRTYLTPEPTKKPTEAQSGWGMPVPSGMEDDEEMIAAVDLTPNTLSGYSAQTEIVGLVSVATVLAIVGYSALCKKNKHDKYIAIEDQQQFV